jgi:hypothetical protein
VLWGTAPFPPDGGSSYFPTKNPAESELG